ncbi:hypothetical protein GCM10023354_14200 [Garicola koreensis]
MKSFSIGQLRQNPTGAFDEVERGETVIVTRYRKEIGRIVPGSPTRRAPTGAQVLEAMRRSPLSTDDNWAQELTRDRAEDRAEDPWVA